MFRFRLDLAASDPAIAANAILGKPVTRTISPQASAARHMHGQAQDPFICVHLFACRDAGGCDAGRGGGAVMSVPFLLTPAQMRRIRPHFPRSRSIPRVDDRRVLSGIIFVLKGGLRWRDLALARCAAGLWPPQDPLQPLHSLEPSRVDPAPFRCRDQRAVRGAAQLSWQWAWCADRHDAPHHN
jgi:transposase